LWSTEDKLFRAFLPRRWLVAWNCCMFMTKMKSVSALMHFRWSGYVVAAWVMHGLVQAGASMAVLWDASLKTAVLQGRLLLFEEDEQRLLLFCCISRGLVWT
jgi:hypothetical protein